MAYFYADFDGSGATAPYDTWAKAAQDLETVLAAMSAGDTLYVQGVATDTAAVTRTFAAPGTVGNPCKIIGVKDGTTNTGTSVATTDLVVRGTDTLPKIETTVATSDMLFNSGYASFYGLHFSCADQISSTNQSYKYEFTGCKITTADDILLNGSGHEMIWVNCEYEPTAATVDIRVYNGSVFSVYGGSLAATASPTVLLRDDSYNVNFVGFDLTNLGNNTIQSPAVANGKNTFVNCKVPAAFTEMGATPTASKAGVIMIGCNSNAAAKGATTSYPDYYYGDAHGVIVSEATIVRTGGADDGASGGFSYAMTPHVNGTLEGSLANLESPWMNVWVAGGATTLTVYIANDTASTDFNEDEVWVEFYTPDASDTAQHDQTFDPANERIVDSVTAITDDTGSTWGTGGNNHQKLSATVTTGFEGFAYARLHFAKRYAATPATLYLDPKIVVT